MNAGKGLPARPDRIAVHRDVVERAEAYLRAEENAAAPLSNVCRLVGMSERGLRNAFYNVRGMSPKQCLLAERLREVRRILLEPPTRNVTVTVVAMNHGFHELGRFAASYRDAFGETPSETLRAAGRKSPPLPAGTKGHTHACTE